ncbi:MAG: SPOR domain-containing protein [Pseudomonadota bacterium]
MGLFSFLNKNKQEDFVDDGAYQARDDDDALAVKARSKRASSAGEPAARRSKDNRADPVLPEKKRARRRLVGAVALALGVAIGLPMILDAEEKPRGNDIDIRIPSKEKAPALPMPAAVAPAESLDKREEIVQEVAPAAAAPRPLPPEPAEVKTVTLKTEPKAPVKAPEKVLPKPAPVLKPAKTDEQRAMAILEGKPGPTAAPQKMSLQVAALSSQDKVNDLMARLKAEGIPASTQKSANGELIRVRVGPFSKDEAEKVRAKLDKLGLSGKALPN